MKKPVTLLIPEKTDIEFEQVFETWISNGGQIKRLGKYWIKDESLMGLPIAIYGNQTFAMVLAQIYNVDLVTPDDTIMIKLDDHWTKRNVLIKQISQITEADFPVFIKSVIPKLFIAGIFQNFSDFKKTIGSLDNTEEVLVSDIINIEAEARCFILNETIKDIALYEGCANLEDAKSFLKGFIKENASILPKTVVVDLAYNAELGWFVLEFNAGWGSGLNNCDAEKIIDCIIGATINPER